MALRTDNLKNFCSDIKTTVIAKGAADPGLINPKDLDNLINSIPSGGGDDIDLLKYEDLDYSIMFGTPLTTDLEYENEILPRAYKLLDKILLGELL